MASLTKRPNGKWRARYRDDTGREHARHFPTQQKAEDWLARVRTARLDGTWVDPQAGRITFEHYFEDWLEQQLYKDTTRRAVVLAARSTPFAHLPINTVRRRHVERWVKEMAVRGLEPGTVHTRANYVRAVFKAAVGDQVIATNPMTGVKLPRKPQHAGGMRVPTVEEVGRLIDTADEDFAVFLALCAFAGLRLGEAAAVQVRDIDFLGRAVRVDRQVQRRGGGQIEVRLPKYDRTRRVPISNQLLDIVGQHLDRRDLTMKAPEAFLFAGPAGDPPHQNTVGYRWRRTSLAAGVEGLTLHDLRHFYASGLIHDGCDVVTVQNALGHSKPTTTLNTYSHLWPSAEDRTRTSSGRLLDQALRGCDASGDRSSPIGNDERRHG
jgi:integrase